jgi:hypothetical protein
MPYCSSMLFSEKPVMSAIQFEEFILSIASETTNKFEDKALYPPELVDLYSLYTKVRNNRSVAIIEFGSGWSTLALARALDENRLSFSQYVEDNVRHPNPFSLMTIDCSKGFQTLALDRIPKELSETIIVPVISEAKMSVLNGQICHLYDQVPPFTADFIYLDGPDCDQVSGDVNGFSVRFGSNEYSYGSPMAADLILLEPFLWPGTLLVTDGRGANASFLKNNFKRNWLYRYDKKCDQHLFQLFEEPFGGISESLLILKEGRLGVE